ncbi:hypothetical protein BG006_000753 [Podila minutissima]|uniref:Uncharacterized protein n=1 Tax=Podila minutissima TaxID=64525 RepID=A0A9P5VPL3_9FUNG|nr:hypothetical protein BG006_000753 [Podila minutissima]
MEATPKKTPTYESTGSALAIGPNVLFAWKQLGMYDELIKLGKRMVASTGYDDDLVAQHVTDWSVRDPL